MITENPPSSIPTPGKSINKKLIFILFIVFGLLFLTNGFIIGYWYSHKQISVSVTPPIPSSTLPPSPTSISTPTPIPIPTSIITPTLTLVPAAAGKIYKDGVYRFELEYPDGYHILEDLLSTNKYKLPAEEESMYALWIVREKYIYPAQNPGIELFIVSTSKTIEEYLQARQQKINKSWQEYLAGFPSRTYQNSQIPGIISINDYQGKFISAKYTVERGIPSVPFPNMDRFYFKKDNILYILSAQYYSKEGEESLIEKETLVKIFNTFKFF